MSTTTEIHDYCVSLILMRFQLERNEIKIVRVVTGVHVEVDDPLDPVSVPVHLVAGAAHVQAHVLAAEVAEAEHRPRGVLAQQKLLLRVPEQIEWLSTTMAHYVSRGGDTIMAGMAIAIPGVFRYIRNR